MTRDPYIAAAIRDLRAYKCAKAADLNLRERLLTLNARMYTPRSSAVSAAPTHGGGSAYEDALARGAIATVPIKIILMIFTTVTALPARRNRGNMWRKYENNPI